MHWALQPVSTGTSTGEPLSLADAKAFLRLPSSSGADDNTLSALITAGRKALELRTRHSFLKNHFDLALDRDAAPCGDDAVEVPISPLSQVLSVKSYDLENTETVMSSSEYLVDTLSEPGRIAVNSGYTWPSSLRRYNAVIVRVEAGYSTAASGVPDPIVQALKMLVAHLYENREPVVIGNIVNELPLGVEALLADYLLPEVL